MSISPLAHVHPEAEISAGVCIDPFAVIHRGVCIGKDSWIGSHAVLMEGTRIGSRCQVFPGSVIGGNPQDLKFNGEESFLEIGNDVIVREFCTLNRGSAATGYTIIGQKALIMAYCHVAHDCRVGDSAVLSNAVNLAGHVSIGEHAILGGMSAVQQFVVIGDHCFIGGGTMVRKNVPPFVKAARDPLSFIGVNTIGLRRRGMEEERIQRIEDIYRRLFVKYDNLSLALRDIEENISDCEEKRMIFSFLEHSPKGIIRGYKGKSTHAD